MQSFKFYFRYAYFQLKERFTDMGSAVAYILLYPFFLWLLVQIWKKFNAYQGNYSEQELWVYVSITELLFMTFLRSTFLLRTHADFSITLARPRSWLKMTMIGQFGSALGGRILYVFIALPVLMLADVQIELVLNAYFRLAFLLPFLGLIEASFSTLLCTSQLIWHETRNFTLPLTKIFLALGGVFAPIADYGEPGRGILLQLMPSDLFFQVGHFCVRGEFYGLTPFAWAMRMAIYLIVSLFVGIYFFKIAKQNHQSLGG